MQTLHNSSMTPAACRKVATDLLFKFHPGELTLLQESMSVSCLRLSLGSLRALDCASCMPDEQNDAVQCRCKVVPCAGGPQIQCWSTLAASLLCCRCRQESRAGQVDCRDLQGFAGCRPEGVRGVSRLDSLLGWEHYVLGHTVVLWKIYQIQIVQC